MHKWVWWDLVAHLAQSATAHHRQSECLLLLRSGTLMPRRHRTELSGVGKATTVDASPRPSCTVRS